MHSTQAIMRSNSQEKNLLQEDSVFRDTPFLLTRKRNILMESNCLLLLTLEIHWWINTNKLFSRGVHGSGWVGLRRFFLSNPPWWVKKNSTQPNPSHKSNLTHMGRVGSSWIHGLDNFIYLLLLLLNWVEKYISHLPPELINKIYINIWTNVPTQLYINI